jgi:ribosomal protein S18 acetylase RimI-like enzyme
VSDQLAFEHATLAETDVLIAIHEEASRWLLARGIRQWKTDTFPRDRLIIRIERGEVYIVRRLDGEPVGMVIVPEADEDTWGEQPNDALYLHGLRVLRAYAGRGRGRAILRSAEGQAGRRGRMYLRLDCMAENTKLRAYYDHARFGYVGEKTREDDPLLAQQPV